ncbi:MAG TPA: plastocyanin/azurin family copper-binding protein [Solirubrobacteraceae bacterium]
MRRKLLRAGVIAVAGLAAGGCALKGGQNVSLVEGKVLFVKNCGRCHTLARAGAGAKGVVGPNLDAAFAESLQQGFGRGIIAGIVEQQIEYPTQGGAMPKLPLSTRQAADIAAYVKYAAARPGQDTGLLASAVPTTAQTTAVEKNGRLAIDANPQGLLAYTAKKATATAGPITISMTNMSGIPHNLAIQQGTAGGVLKATPISSSGTHLLTLNLKPGTYTFFCQVQGHRAAGMFGTLTVK